MITPSPVLKAASALFATLLVVAMALPAGSVAAQSTTPTGPLSLDSLTPWVAPDGVWNASFTLRTPVAGATLTYTIHRPLSGGLDQRLDALDAMWDKGTVPAGLLSPVRKPLDSMTDGTKVTLSIGVRSRSDGSDRAFLPNPGLHPVEIELTGPDGTELQRLVLPLVRAPSKVPAPLRLALVVRSEAGPAMTVQRGVAPPTADVTDLGRIADAVDHAQGVPLTISITPSLLEAIALGGSDSEQNLLARIRSADHATTTIAWEPWVPLDLEAWAVHGQSVDVATAFASGADTVTRRVGRTPDTSAIDADGHLGPTALRVLRDLGIDRVVVDAAQVEGGAPQTPLLFTLTGDHESAVTALARAADIQQALTDATATPAERSARALSAVALRALDSNSDEQHAMVVDLDRDSGDATQALLDAVASGRDAGLVEPVALPEAFEGTARATTGSRSRRQPFTRRVATPASIAEVAPLSKRLTSLRSDLRGRDSMVADDAPVTLDDLLLTAQHRALSLAAATSYLDAVATRVEADLSAVVAPRGRRYTVTARSATIPLQFSNDLSTPAKVLVRFESTRITFDEGQSTVVTLQPGVNQIPVRVRVRTSGQFRVGVETLTPDGSVKLGRTELTIRSTAFSGVGVVLSAGALAFLLVWWARTLRRERRQRRHPGGDQPGGSLPAGG